MVRKRYDLHTHTNFSFDSVNDPAKMVETAKKAGLNGIAITDHNTIKGALIVKRLNKDRNFEVIVGEEVASDCGDVIGLYITKEIRERKLLRVIDSIKRQGGLVVIPHPYKLGSGFSYPIEKLVGKIDAIETFNSKHPHSNMIASKVAKRLSLAQTGSSDGHSYFDIGNGYTVFEGDFRTALRRKGTRVGGTTVYGTMTKIMTNVSQLRKILGLYRTRKS
jgi:predicted metal-dependent phosphoesterase TrpH